VLRGVDDTKKVQTVLDEYLQLINCNRTSYVVKQPLLVQPPFPPIFGPLSNKSPISILSHLQSTGGIYDFLRETALDFDAIDKTPFLTEEENSDEWKEISNELQIIAEKYSPDSSLFTKRG